MQYQMLIYTSFSSFLWKLVIYISEQLQKVYEKYGIWNNYCNSKTFHLHVLYIFSTLVVLVMNVCLYTYFVHPVPDPAVSSIYPSKTQQRGLKELKD